MKLHLRQGYSRVRIGTHRQSRRNRLPDHQDGASARHAHHRGAFAGGCGCAVRADGRRGLGDRPGTGVRILSAHRQGDRCGAQKRPRNASIRATASSPSAPNSPRPAPRTALPSSARPALGDQGRMGPQGCRPRRLAQKGGRTRRAGLSRLEARDPDFLRQKAYEIGLSGADQGCLPAAAARV